MSGEVEAELAKAVRQHETVATGLGEWACKCSPMEWRPSGSRGAHLAAALAPVVRAASERAVEEAVQAVEAELDDADQLADTIEKPNYIAVWGVRRALMRFGGKPHRWPVPAEFCAECGHNEYDHDNEGGDECAQPDCDCLLSRREVRWGRDEAMDDTITQALWEDAVTNDEPWTRDGGQS